MFIRKTAFEKMDEKVHSTLYLQHCNISFHTVYTHIFDDMEEAMNNFQCEKMEGILQSRLESIINGVRKE